MINIEYWGVTSRTFDGARSGFYNLLWCAVFPKNDGVKKNWFVCFDLVGLWYKCHYGKLFNKSPIQGRVLFCWVQKSSATGHKNLSHCFRYHIICCSFLLKKLGIATILIRLLFVSVLWHKYQHLSLSNLSPNWVNVTRQYWA